MYIQIYNDSQAIGVKFEFGRILKYRKNSIKRQRKQTKAKGNYVQRTTISIIQ